MANRAEVYDALDSERAYQQKRWGDKPHEIDAWVLYIRDYAEQLKRVASTSDDVEMKLDFVRKVGGLAVVCMEQHGAPLRKVLP